MDPNKIELEQVFEGLAASGMRTILWDANDLLVYADPGMHELYESLQVQLICFNSNLIFILVLNMYFNYNLLFLFQV